MVPASHNMETVRQFLAAFAEPNWDALYGLLATDASARVLRKDWEQSWPTQTAVVQGLLKERARWAQKRIDVQGWRSTPPMIEVGFVVQLQPDEPGQFQRYEMKLTIRRGQVQRLDLHTAVLTAALPAWEKGPGNAVQVG